MDYFLGTALVLSNLLWLVFLRWNLQVQREDRRELQNRIAQPKLIVSQGADSGGFPEPALEMKDAYEYAGVGQVNPYLGTSRPEFEEEDE